MNFYNKAARRGDLNWKNIFRLSEGQRTIMSTPQLLDPSAVLQSLITKGRFHSNGKRRKAYKKSIKNYSSGEWKERKSVYMRCTYAGRRIIQRFSPVGHQFMLMSYILTLFLKLFRFCLELQVTILPLSMLISNIVNNSSLSRSNQTTFIYISLPKFPFTSFYWWTYSAGEGELSSLKKGIQHTERRRQRRKVKNWDQLYVRRKC